jgi:hypothetical protein
MARRKSGRSAPRTGLAWFDSLVASRLYRLQEMGYSLAPAEIEDRDGSHVVRLRFHNRLRKRLVIVRFKVEGPSSDLGFFIYREPERSMDDTFDLSAFATKSGLASVNELVYRPGATLEKETERLMDLYSSLLLEKCYSIVAGESWEKGYYYEWT